MLETNYEEHDYKNTVSKGSLFRWPTLQPSWLLMRQPPHQLGSPDLAARDKHPIQPKPKHFNGETKQNTSPLDGPQKGPALLIHNEQKHSDRFKLGIYRQKEPSWYLMYILRLHTQNLSHNTSGQASIVQNCLALSTLHICLVLSAVRKRWQKRLTGHLYRLSRPHPS